jgi:hypothetical protein
VGKKLDTVLDFDSYLMTVDMQNTNAAVVGFLDVGGTFIITFWPTMVDSVTLTTLKNTGKMLAEQFLKAEDAKLVRSFLVLYCAQQTGKKPAG